MNALRPSGYIPRIADRLIEDALSEFGGVEVCGLRWCGKSWTSMAHGASMVRIDENPSIYEDDPHLALLGDRPHVIDEWQDAPQVWNAARHAIDDAGNVPGQFILTGSSAPPDEKGAAQRHTGAGRIARVPMETMTMLELGKSRGGVSLKGLFGNQFTPLTSDTSLEDLAMHICTGGWPALAQRGDGTSARLIGQYLDALFERSMPKAGKSPSLARRIATSLARNNATAATLATIAKDSAPGGDKAPTAETVASYLEVFSRNYAIRELPGWDAPIRSKTRLRTKPKRYFADPSLTASLLGVGPERVISDSQLYGLLFESLAIHDISVFAQCLPGYTSESLRYYTDGDGLEVDLIIELADGRWAGVEIKLGESKVDEAFKNLNRLRAKVAANPAARNPAPEFMAVVLGRGAAARYAYEEQCFVIPLDLLEP